VDVDGDVDAVRYSYVCCTNAKDAKEGVYARAMQTYIARRTTDPIEREEKRSGEEEGAI
jgi:hypothetical protein